MRTNTYYLLVGAVAIFVVSFFWWSMITSNPFPLMIAFLIGATLLYYANKRISEVTEDEMTAMITQKAAWMCSSMDMIISM
jgi:uncharacterized membrane protein